MDECVARVCVSQGAQLSEASVSHQLTRFHDIVSVDLKKRSLQSLGDNLLNSKALMSPQLYLHLTLLRAAPLQFQFRCGCAIVRPVPLHA